MVASGADGARILRYELVEASAPQSAISDDKITSTMLLEAVVNLKPGDDYLMRCDRVDLPPGGIAYTHTHQGPGTRCLLQGGMPIHLRVGITASALSMSRGMDISIASGPFG